MPKSAETIEELKARIDRLTESLSEAQGAIEEIFGLMDQGILVRCTGRDHEPGWSLKALSLTRVLLKAQSAMEKANA